MLNAAVVQIYILHKVDRYKCAFLLQIISRRSIAKHRKIIIPEHPHIDAFISVKIRDSPSSTTANLSDLSALVIVPA